MREVRMTFDHIWLWSSGYVLYWSRDDTPDWEELHLLSRETRNSWLNGGIIKGLPLNSRVGKREKVKGEYGGILGEGEENSDYGGMVKPSQQHVAPCVKGVEWGRGYIGGQRSPTLPSGHPSSRLIRHAGKRWAYSTPRP